MIGLVVALMTTGLVTLAFGIRCLIVAKNIDDVLTAFVSLTVSATFITFSLYNLLKIFLPIIGNTQ